MCKIIACYYRVSRYTGEYDESQSIKNQRLIANLYIRNNYNQFTNYKINEYIDDGYSGKNADRPALISLLNDIKNNKIGCIIVKDFSRFSRDYLYMGEFLERINYNTYIRFISINDNYDNKKGVNIKNENTIDEAFKHIIYDYYSVDNSVKIKKGLESSRSRGNYIASRPIYGYQIQNGKLVINEEEANIVRQIFQSYANGVKISAIESYLNKIENNIQKKKTVWNKAKIYRILREEQYTGVMIYGKRRTKEIGSNKRVYVPKSQWKVIENHHEAIIDKELFMKVRDICDKKNDKKNDKRIDEKE